MKHASTRALYAYWNERRSTRAAPDRADIDPADIRHELGDTFMLAADFVDQLRFRLAGTRVCALFCRELKGEGFTALWDEDGRKAVDDLMAIVVGEQTGVVAGLTGHTADGATIELELLVLPLAYAGHARIRALGILAPIEAPYWLGEKPITSLELGAMRHIGASLEQFNAPPFVPAQEEAPIAAPAGAQIRHGFVVYSGGRESAAGDKTG